MKYNPKKVFVLDDGILPAPKYAVSFVVTPAELANVVIKVNG